MQPHKSFTEFLSSYAEARDQDRDNNLCVCRGDTRFFRYWHSKSMVKTSTLWHENNELGNAEISAH